MQFLHLISYIAALRNSKNQPQPALTRNENRWEKANLIELEIVMQKFAISTFDGVCLENFIYLLGS